MRVAQTLVAATVALMVVGLLGSACNKGTAPAPAAHKAPAQAGAQQATTQTICPVMKSPIDRELFVDFEGKRVYVCCSTCLAAVRKDPAKYVKQLEDEGIVLEKVAPPAAGRK
jgi:YHS domain-containing protein